MTKQETIKPSLSIHARMVEILRDLDAIGKDKKTTMTNGGNFNYRGIDDVYNAINPLLAKHGVFMTAEVVGKTREERTNAKGTVLAFTCLHMRYHFQAEDGTSVTTEAEGEGMDSGDKSSNKAMAVAHKYALLQAFCVPTKDMEDPDKECHEVAPAEKPQAVTRHADTSASTDRKQAAANWCYEARDHVLTIETSLGLDTWAKKNAKAMDTACDLAPNAFKALSDALHKQQSTITPMAAE